MNEQTEWSCDSENGDGWEQPLDLFSSSCLAYQPGAFQIAAPKKSKPKKSKPKKSKPKKSKPKKSKPKKIIKINLKSLRKYLLDMNDNVTRPYLDGIDELDVLSRVLIDMSRAVDGTSEMIQHDILEQEFSELINTTFDELQDAFGDTFVWFLK